MKKYTVDFTGVKSLWGFHDVLKNGLELPDFYGMNLDALWDCLTGFIDAPCIVYVRGIDDMSMELDEIKGEVIEIFNQTQERYSRLNSAFSFVYL